jgi:hypothetical protein
MKLDPARWPALLQWVVLGALVGLAALSVILGAGRVLGPIGSAALLVLPGLIGGLIWRYSAVPWRDIASWTVPLTIWVLVAPMVVAATVRWLFVATPATIWLAVFVFWLPPVRWWYRVVLRKPYPMA